MSGGAGDIIVGIITLVKRYKLTSKSVGWVASLNVGSGIEPRSSRSSFSSCSSLSLKFSSYSSLSG